MSWIIGIVSFLLFAYFAALGIVGGDSGDLVVAAVTHGVPHPPGYPLYTFLGWLASLLPFGTPAWRVGLLSSVPHALTLVLVYRIIFILTKNRIASLFGTLVLLGNYLFFFYSITPEVFGLFDLFVVLLLYLLIIKRYYLWSFVFGLSLTHHHAILFFVPAMIYLLWINRKGLRFTILVFFLGLLPYLYIPVAARSNAPVNWDRVTTLSNFFRLVTRADYGTFQSGAAIGTHISQRLLQLKAYAQYALLDFTWIGIVFLFFGLLFLFRKKKTLFVTFVLGIVCLGPLFFFYASFPLVNRFTLGTYERFLLPSYTLFAIVLGVGVAAFERWMSRTVTSIVAIACVCIFFVYPVTMAGITFWRCWGLSSDRTGDNLGIDVISHLPPNSIAILSQDTVLFTSQYIRYALGIRPDVIVIQRSALPTRDYQQTLHQLFPTLIIPPDYSVDFIREFVSQNVKDRPIFMNDPIPVPDGWYWVPFGLVYRLYDKDSLSDVPTMRDTNIALWKTYQDPSKGILGRYNHLMLSDIRDVYAKAKINFGQVLLRAHDIPRAREQFIDAISFGGDSQLKDAYMNLGLTELFDKKCNEAISAFSSAQNASFSPDANIAMYQSITYRDCVGDEKKAV